MKDQRPSDDLSRLPAPGDREGVVVKSTREDTRFIEAVKRGEDALERGEFLTHEQVGKRLGRFLKS